MFLSEFTKSGGREWKVFLDPDRIWGIEQNGADSTLLVDRTGGTGPGGGFWAVRVKGGPVDLYAEIIADRLANHKRPLTMSRGDAVALMEERLTAAVLDKVVELLKKDVDPEGGDESPAADSGGKAPAKARAGKSS